ncbi:hypothetical protein [Rubritalea tangerina]|uniref:hypothetical protein n=1 Tax=Rubritalea tangerina TaxID=430798 RepID=UPI00361019DF
MTSRRTFLSTSFLAAAGLSTRSFAQETAAPSFTTDQIKLSLKIGMVGFGKTPDEKFKGIKDLGYDGMELNSPGGLDKKACLAASQKYNFPIHGVVNSTHWRTQLSNPSAEIREKALQDLLTAIDDSALCGGHAVLLVPAVVNKKSQHPRSLGPLHRGHSQSPPTCRTKRTTHPHRKCLEQLPLRPERRKCPVSGPTQKILVPLLRIVHIHQHLRINPKTNAPS